MRVAPPMARVMSWVSDRPRRTPRRVSRENFTGTSSPAVCRSLFVTLIVYSFGGRGAGGGDCFGGGGDGSVLGGRGAGLDGGAAAGVAGGGGVCAAASAVCSPWVPSAVPALGPAVAAPLATLAPITTPAATGPAAAAPPPPAAAPPPPAALPLLAAGIGAGVFGGGGALLPPPVLPPVLPPPLLPSSTFFGSAPPCGLDGTGIGRLRALLASCSEPIAWYMSNPANAMNL